MDLPDKSKPAAPKKKLTAVVSGAEEMKRPATKRFMDAMFSGSPKSMAGNVAHTVIMPQIKAGMEQAFNAFIHGIFWGDGSAPQGLVRGPSVRGGVAYSAQSTQSAMALARQASPVESSVGYRDLVYPTLQDAEMVLAGLYDALNEYRVVAVGDLYELSNKSPAISDNAIGWRSLDGARISSVGARGFVLELPRPTAI